MEDIRDYYVIGDLHSAALVSKNASIDWLCLPHFDLPSIFAKILDKNSGEFSTDKDDYSVTSKYIPDTAIIQFAFKNKYSEFILKDFMVPQPTKSCENHFLVRKFTGISGTSKVKLYFCPKSEYANKRSLTRYKKSKDTFSTDGLVLKTSVGKDSLLLYLPKDSFIEQKKEGYEITLKIQSGKDYLIVLEYVVKNHKPLFKSQNLEKQTANFWDKWVKKGNYFDVYRDKLVRSAITLKLMQFYPTGAIVAAPTTSLPENIGGERNWDYRYVWIRDATFTLYAFYVLGYLEEAERFFEFIQNIIEKCKQDSFDIFLMYTITGDPVPKEKALEYLSGYKNSKPVRVGNGARDQFQLDVYGALIDSYYFVSKRKIKVPKMHKNLVMNLVKKISETWLKKDSGIWEVRSEPQHFTYSKVMAWVGVNRAVRMAKQLELTESEINFCQSLEKQIYNWIWENCYDPGSKTFKQHPQSSRQDATNFLFVLLQFLNKHDPLTKTIIKQTCKELSYKNVFVYRYLTEDGLKSKEGAFLLCTFWLIAAWAILEDVDEAQKLFNKFEDYMDDSELLSEEIDPDTGEYLGNFPQAFSHIGFIMSVYYLYRYKQSLRSFGSKAEA
ncbi:glycoside hydrolase family 15 protein [Candidatus Daviesbacteria bacterium]|nr:glycoside hydrolase family 15 protein [Candidatus Daviesbacteria bacterium]